MDPHDCCRAAGRRDGRSQRSPRKRHILAGAGWAIALVLVMVGCGNEEPSANQANLLDSSPVVDLSSDEDPNEQATDAGGGEQEEGSEADSSDRGGSGGDGDGNDRDDAGSESATASDDETEPGAAEEPEAGDESAQEEQLRLNHLQVIGSHNSYHLRPREEIFSALVALAPDLATSIEYSHVSLTEQLETYGVRQFEIDVFADPDGGRWANYAAHPLVNLEAPSGEPLLDEPGFKVLHTQDFDYATNCLTLVICLTEIRDYSDANPNHLPIMVMIEIKDESIADAAGGEGLDISVFDVEWSEPTETTAEVLEDLDEEIRSVFEADQLITPDDVRGDAETLEASVLAGGWPTVAESRGRVLFTMTNGGTIRERYLDGAPNIEGRPIFTSSAPGSPDAAFVRFDDPTSAELNAVAESGYLIRTRTDSPTADARNNDTTRRDIAMASGAHYLSTDYYAPSEFFDSPYVVDFANGAIARCNPITAPASCNEADLTE